MSSGLLSLRTSHYNSITMAISDFPTLLISIDTISSIVHSHGGVDENNNSTGDAHELVKDEKTTTPEHQPDIAKEN